MDANITTFTAGGPRYGRPIFWLGTREEGQANRLWGSRIQEQSGRSGEKKMGGGPGQGTEDWDLNGGSKGGEGGGAQQAWEDRGETRDRHSHSLGGKRKDEGSDIKESGVPKCREWSGDGRLRQVTAKQERLV
ncbi:hypothetical protein N7533_004433 [Penicillium manginii]|uniref:uncharacterized protein n=1 Tax=Penicillium manginii TaxID=203109 RepID=UPI002548BA8E|nr:uncharacterized protein N7533_004433 [Penicillium manginii]KAJ5754890.1 hypothetical protein N7533_004433 [Penicillium manginii]